MYIFHKLIFKLANHLAEFKYSKNKYKKKVYNALFYFSENFIFPSDNRLQNLIKLKKKYNKNLYIFIVPIWGKIYSEAFFNHFFPSFLSPNNIWWLKRNYNVKIFIYYDDIFQKKLDKNAFFKKQFTKLKIICRKIQDYTQDKNKDYLSSIILKTYIEHAQECIKNNATSINLSTDFILPSNYLKNLSTIIHGKPFCYSHSHMRVNPSILKKINQFKKNNIIVISEQNLVNLSKKHAYSHIKYQNDELDSNLTHLGFSWRKVNHENYSVVNGVIGTLTFNFIEEDIYFLKSLQSWSGHDRQIPQYLLTSKRMKLISSSDLAFFSEVSYFDTKVELKSDNKFNDLTKSNKLASNIWNSVVGNWRS